MMKSIRIYLASLTVCILVGFAWTGECAIQEGSVGALSFSRERGIYQDPFELTITAEIPGVRIYYTLDGSRPSLDNGTLYRGPLQINQITLLRAIGIRDGFDPSPEVTHSYIFLNDVLIQPANPPGLPSTWGTDSEVGVVPTDYEMDGNVVRGVVNGIPQEFTVEEALLSLPSVSIVTTMDDLFGLSNGIYTHPKERSDAWEREVSVEWIYPDGRDGFQVRAGLKMQGNSSRRPFRMQKHSFRLDFQGDYGTPKLEEEIIDGSTNDGFNKLILRACFTDSWGLVSWSPSRYRPNDSQYIRDVWMKYSHLDMGHPAARSTFVHLYINGLYWGIYNPCERLDEDFMASYLGGTETDWDILHDGGAELRSGTRVAWNQLQSRAIQGFGNMDNYLAVQGLDPTGTPDSNLDNLLNVTSLADYMLLHFHAHAEDWPHNNWYAARSRVDGTGFQFFTWDQEIALDNPALNRINDNPDNNPARVFQSLRQNEEFRLLFADRVYRHLFHEGALTESAGKERYSRLADQIDPAIVAESARWGDVSRSIPYTRDQEWVTERDIVLNEYIPSLVATSIQRFRSAGLYPEMDPPEFSHRNGPVERGTLLEIIPPAEVVGRIYYTLDGSDPRLPSWEATGARFTSPTAKVYRIPIELNGLTHVKARFFTGENWSALNETTIVVGSPKLAITEIHYNPADPDPDEVAAGWNDAKQFEFIELANIGDATLDLEGYTLSEGIGFDFAGRDRDLLRLEPGEIVLVVENLEAFAARYGAALSDQIIGQYTGALSNNGERITLRDQFGNEVVSVLYGDQFPWPETADGAGRSLELIQATDSWNDPSSWKASENLHGSPGSWTGFVVVVDPFTIQTVSLESGLMTLAVNVSDLPEGLLQALDPGDYLKVRYRETLQGSWTAVEPESVTQSDQILFIQIDISKLDSDQQGFFQLFIEVPQI